MNELQQAISLMATKEQVIEALGLKEDKSEEFWEIQLFTVRNRFLAYLLYKHRLDLTLFTGHVDGFTRMDLASTAEDLLAKGVNYTFIRNWWKSMGTYLHNRAFDAKREREKIAKMDVVVLVFFEKGRPYYLTYKDNKTSLVADVKDAHGFPIMSISELDKNYLANAAKDFDAVVKEFGATHVKLLPRQKD